MQMTPPSVRHKHEVPIIHSMDVQDVPDSKQKDPVFFILFLFILSGIGSVSVTLFNKSISAVIDNLWTVVFVQNGTVFVIYAILNSAGIIQVNPLTFKQLSLLMVSVTAMIFMLWLSLKALAFTSVPLYVVARNTVPLCSAGLEYILLSKKQTMFAISALFLIFFGTIFYSLNDSSAEYHGLTFATLNTLVVAGLGVYEKTIMMELRDQQTPLGMNMIRVGLSLPILLLFVTLIDGYEGFQDLSSIEALSYVPMFYFVVFSGFFCAMIGGVNFTLQSLVSATSISVANTSYKFLTTAFSLITHPPPVGSISIRGWLGYGICSIGFVCYTFQNVDMSQFFPSKRKVSLSHV